jgi:ATP-dependent Clp protease protease subunit
MKYNDRFLYLMQDFNDMLSLHIVKQLFELDSKNTRDIILVINSDGGDVEALFAIHDAIKIVKSDVATLCIGHAFSCAADLLISGTKGKRFMTPISSIMFHEMMMKMDGSTSNFNDEMVSIKHYNNMLAKIAKDNLNPAHYKQALRTRKDNYFNAEQALKIGAIDHIVTSINDMTSVLNTKKQ